MNLTLRRKIIGLTILAAILPVCVMFALTVEFQARIGHQAETDFDALSRMNIDQIARDVYGLCETANDLIQRKINHDLNVARKILYQQGSIRLNSEMVSWEARARGNYKEHIYRLGIILTVRLHFFSEPHIKKSLFKHVSW